MPNPGPEEPLEAKQTVLSADIKQKAPSLSSLSKYKLPVWVEASEISVYQLSHATDFSPPHHDSTPPHPPTQP